MKSISCQTHPFSIFISLSTKDHLAIQGSWASHTPPHFHWNAATYPIEQNMLKIKGANGEKLNII